MKMFSYGTDVLKDEKKLNQIQTFKIKKFPYHRT